jgi:hypothetical protein
MGGQNQVRAALPRGKTQYLSYKRLDRPEFRSGRVRKISHPTGIRSPGRPGHSEYLYRLGLHADLQSIIKYFFGCWGLLLIVFAVTWRRLQPQSDMAVFVKFGMFRVRHWSVCVQSQSYILVTINTELPIRNTCNLRKIVTAKEGGGTGWRSSLRHCATSWVRFPMVQLAYFSDSLLRTALRSCSQSIL